MSLLLLLALLIPSAPAQADHGPKPMQQYTFRWQAVQPVAILSGQLLQCHAADCADAAPLARLGPQRLTCTDKSCSALSYGFSPYQRLVITFADRTRTSNVFSQRGFNADFVVIVQPDDLIVREELTSGRVSPYQLFFFFPALLWNVVIECTIAFVYARIRRLRRLLRWVLLANLLSLPVAWFLVPLLPLGTASVVGLGEIFVFCFEAWFLWATNRRQLTPRSAAALSLLINGPSFVLGFWLF
ncbi:MAG: hypothetical protein NVS4B8_27340 [Herpetosiphon sp.]